MRYFIAYILFTMGMIGDEISILITKVLTNPDEFQKYNKGFDFNDPAFQRKAKFYIFRKLILAKKELIIFSKIDSVRKDGFYCDYEDYLKSPATFTMTEYQEIVYRLEKVKKIINFTIEGFNTLDDTSLKYIGALKKSMKSQKYYLKISNTIIKIKQERQNPFELVRNYKF